MLDIDPYAFCEVQCRKECDGLWALVLIIKSDIHLKVEFNVHRKYS